MEWTRKSKYHSESTSGYRISVSGQKGRRVFTAWAPSRALIGNFKDGTDKEKVEAAKAACVEHYIRAKHGSKSDEEKAEGQQPDELCARAAR